MSYQLLTNEEAAGKRDLIFTPFPLINSVVWGKQEGKIFTLGDNFFILHKSGFSYFKLKDGFDDYPALINFILQTKELPVYFHVYDASQKLYDVCLGFKEKLNIKMRNRIQLKYKGSALPGVSSNMPEGFYARQITQENFSSLAVFNLALEGKFWKSAADFTHNGFGFVVFTKAGDPVSICYSACVANKVAEIDVATLPGFQQKGLAKEVVYKFVNHCLANNMIANWDCFEENMGSIKTAMSVGFENVFSYEFLSIYNNQKAI